MVELTHQPIDSNRLLRSLQSPEAGAIVMFLGVARRMTADRETIKLTYDAYQEMATKEMERLDAEVRRRWPIENCLIVHRLGLVPLGEASVAVGVATAHRADAFEAGQWLIDTLKECVPIWKQEHWADGTREWVHPGLDVSSADSPESKAT